MPSLTHLRAAALALTAAMLVLHGLEWGSMRGAGRRRLRPALWLESVYYLLLFPVYWTAPGMVRAWMILLAAYHWGGLAYIEATGALERTVGRAGIRAIAAFDLGEMAVLVWFGWRLW